MKVLVAEDDPTTSTMLEVWLTDWGYDPICVADGNSAWQILIADNPPQLAIFDWMMPGLDGVQLCEKIKQHTSLPFIYALLLTCRSNQEDIIMGLNKGADDFLTKPVHPEELRSRLTAGKRILHYQEALADRNQQLQQLLSAMPGAVLFKDGNNCWLQANQHLLELFVLTHVDYLGKTDKQLAQYSHIFKNCLATLQVGDKHAWEQQRVVRQEIEIKQEYKTQWYEFIRAPLYDRLGTRKSLILLGYDITDRKILEERLVYEAQYDSLTKLLNRRYFNQRLEIATQNARRFKQPISLCLCDIDHFKNINDRHGHRVGDQVLIYFSDILRRELRASDAVARLSEMQESHHETAGRIGGDEFCILLVGTNISDSLICLARIREQLESIEFTGKNGEIFQVSGSFGVAEWTENMKNEVELIEAADRALYRAKHKGRNQIVIYQPEFNTDSPATPPNTP